MLRFANYDIVFSEIPDEVTLAVNIAACPNRCQGCHSVHLWKDEGEVLSEENLEVLLRQYGSAITCVCFMGGDAEPLAVAALARFVRHYGAGLAGGEVATGCANGGADGREATGLAERRFLKTAWYSGKDKLPDGFPVKDFQYIKLGGYVEALGGLNKPTTNQRLYRIEEDGKLVDMTARFWKKG